MQAPFAPARRTPMPEGAPLRPYIPEASGNDAAIVLAGADLEQRPRPRSPWGRSPTPGSCACPRSGSSSSRGSGRSSVRCWSRRSRRCASAIPLGRRPTSRPLGDSPGRGARAHGLAEALALGGEIIAGRGEDGPFFTPTVVRAAARGVGDDAVERGELRPASGLMLAADPDDAARRRQRRRPRARGERLRAGRRGRRPRLRAARVVVDEDPLYQDPHFVVGGIGDSGLFGARPKLEQLVYARRVHRAAGALAQYAQVLPPAERLQARAAQARSPPPSRATRRMARGAPPHASR